MLDEYEIERIIAAQKFPMVIQGFSDTCSLMRSLPSRARV
jgi:hypothetical protein